MQQIPGELLSGRNAALARRVMQAIRQMVKLDIKKLKQGAQAE